MVHYIVVAELASDDRETDCAEPVQRFSGRLDSSSRRSVCRSVLAGRTRAIAAAIRGGFKKHEDAARPADFGHPWLSWMAFTTSSTAPTMSAALGSHYTRGHGRRTLNSGMQQALDC